MDGDHMEPPKNSSHGGNSGEQDGCGSATPPPVSSDEAATCLLCGKTFASRKAMYGHMRCHPERERKGGRAPQTTSPAEKPCDQIDCSSSLAPPLPGWSKTRKRGSKGTATATAAVDREPRALENSAPGGSPEEAETKEVGKREAASEEEPDSEVSTTNAGSPDEESELPHCEGKVHGLGTQACNYDCCRKLRSSSFQKKRRAEDAEVEAAGSRSYACEACGKTFPSFQALGGHMANHGKHTERGSDVGRGGGVGSAVAAGGSKPTQRRHLEPTNEEHRCNVCGKVYPTGQALGGHKRLHWEGLKRPPASGGAAAPSPRELQRASSTPRVRDFDLNELPEKEDYDKKMHGWV